MKYCSTRGGIEPISFTEATMMGLAADGGLILPTHIPNITKVELKHWRTLSYPDLASEILHLFSGNAIPREELKQLVFKSYATFTRKDVIPVISMGDVFVAELFHGPTLAFKDVALQFLGNLFEYILEQTQQTITILGATSGDTGSAAIHGVRGKKNIKIFILHPDQRVSLIQKLQMTTIRDKNVCNIAIKGTFDDGQRIIKSLFNDLDFKLRYHLSAVNSINWVRVAAQIPYYFYGAFRVMEKTGKDAVQICVPTGNFGNFFAGYIAKKMGAPISKLLLATNENDILVRFFQSGMYERRTLQKTSSPSMDIEIASNFERYLYYYSKKDPDMTSFLIKRFETEGSPSKLSRYKREKWIHADSATQEEMFHTIRSSYNNSNYVLDPHSAIGVSVAQRNLKPDIPTLCLATAHPAKFEEVTRQALGCNPTKNETIEALRDTDSRCITLPATEKAIRSCIETKNN